MMTQKIREGLSQEKFDLYWAIHSAFLLQGRTYRGPPVLTMQDWARFIYLQIHGAVPVYAIISLVSVYGAILSLLLYASSALAHE